MLIAPVMRAILLPGRVALPPTLLNPAFLLLPCAGLILSTLRRRLPASYVWLSLMLLGLLSLGVRGALLLRLLSTRVRRPLALRLLGLGVRRSLLLLLLRLLGLGVRRSLLLLLLRLLSTCVRRPLALWLLSLRVRRSLLLLLLRLLTRVRRPLALRLLGLGVRRSLLLLPLRLLSAPVGWPLLLALLPLSGRLLSVVLAALRTAEPGRGKEKNNSRYCMNTFHRWEPHWKQSRETQIKK
jgi:hypothetical protein